jgi:hypothetical protein
MYQIIIIAQSRPLQSRLALLADRARREVFPVILISVGFTKTSSQSGGLTAHHH